MKIRIFSLSALLALAILVWPFERGVRASANPMSGSAEKPPIGKYVCRQYTTTMGYLTLKNGDTYEVSKVPGKYAFDLETSEVVWKSGKYKEWGWTGKYEVVAREDGRSEEFVIRITGENGRLKINCYYMAHQD